MKKNINMFFMQEALKQAKKALNKREVPVGAIIVGPDNKILSRAYNKIEILGCQTGHAEVLAIKKACKKLNTWRLDDCSIYITLEPCLMCFGLIQLSRIKNLYFGAKSQDFGSGLKSATKKTIYKKDLKVVGGLKEIESADILKQFFKELRLLKKEKGLLCKKELRH